MSENTKIEWADHTFNPWVGCTKVSPACDHCYAEGWANRSGAVQWGSDRKRTSPANWRMPVKWNKQAQAAGRRYRVFCASLADVFDNAVPTAWREDLFALIRSTPHLDWLLLTKRIGNANTMVQAALANLDIGYSVPFAAWPWPNVWLGATVCNQDEAERDIPKLLAVPARVRFLSIEPMLGPIDIQAALNRMPWQIGGGEAGLHWVICGGESGPGARPMPPAWARSLRDQCAEAGVPFLFKQWGEHTAGEPTSEKCHPSDKSAWRRDQRGQAWNDPYEAGKPMSEWVPVKFLRVGKKAAGRLLDGVEHNGFPEAAC